MCFSAILWLLCVCSNIGPIYREDFHKLEETSSKKAKTEKYGYSMCKKWQRNVWIKVNFLVTGLSQRNKYDTGRYTEHIRQDYSTNPEGAYHLIHLEIL